MRPLGRPVFTIWTPWGAQVLTVWRHPARAGRRWHRYSVEFWWWQRWRRWLFDRCENCGQPFRGSHAYSSRWENDKPGLLQSTPGLYHEACLKERDAFSHHLRRIKLCRALGIHHEGT